MRIGKRIFPYPIIHNSSPSHSFYESYFSFHYKIESQENLFIIKDIYYKLENTYINRLINENKVKVVCIVECSHTVFRKKYEIYKEPKNIEIPIHFLNDKVEISAYAYATQNIDNYRHCDFIYEYTGYNFQIEKYDILAADDGYTVKVNYEETKDKSVSSIFLIIKNMTENEGLMRIELSRNKIKILLPEEQFNIYDRMRKQPIFKNFYFCIFCIPSLTYAFDKIKKDSESINLDSIRLDYPWFESVLNSYKKFEKKELTNEEFEQISSFELAQKLMDMPVTKAISELFRFFVSQRGDFDD